MTVLNIRIEDHSTGKVMVYVDKLKREDATDTETAFADTLEDYIFDVMKDLHNGTNEFRIREKET